MVQACRGSRRSIGWTILGFIAAIMIMAQGLALARDPLSTPFREAVSLDGTWRFMPAAGSAAQEPTGNWGTIPVPGMWTDSKRGVPTLLEGADGHPWDEEAASDSRRGWYERKITVPASWEGREVMLDLSRVSTDAVVYVDGKECGAIDWPGGRVTLTPHLTAGKEHTLRILVVAVKEKRDLPKAKLPDFTPKGESGLEGMGIIGHARLLSRPSGGGIEGLFIKSSVEKGTLDLDVTLRDVPTRVKTTFTAVVRDMKGRAVRHYTTVRTLPLTEGTAPPSLTLTIPADGLRVWDYKQPNLYTLELAVSGPGYRDSIKERFGYREFAIVGKGFVLNGKPYRLRPNMISDEWMDNSRVNLVSALKERFDNDFNLVEIWPWDPGTRGKAHYWETIVEAADEMGMPIMYPMTEDMKQATGDWARIRNNPSVVILTIPANRYGIRDDDNPLRIGNNANLLYTKVGNSNSAKPGLRAVESLRALDPTRVVTSHHGGAVGQFQATNNYLNFIPLQEREDWLSEWVRSGDKPYMAVEFGLPLLGYSYLRGRSFDRLPNTEPWMTEFNAMYLGPDAYKLEPEGYRRELVTKFEGGQNYGNWHMNTWLHDPEPVQRMYRLFITNTWRSWRAWGITGGMVPWDFGAPGELRNSPAGRSLLSVNGPTLAYIAGAAGDFTSKDHSYFQGARVAKQVVLINDLREDAPYSLKWTATVGGRTIASGKGSGMVGVGRNLFLPVSFTAPPTPVKVGGTITLTATIGGVTHKDSFGFRVFPQAKAPAKGSGVMVWDPEGDTTAMLKGLGYGTTAWDGKSYPGKVLFVGRNALSGGYTVPGPIEGHTRSGGVCVIMGQDPEYLRKNQGFRVARHVSRRAFPVSTQTGHPVLKGLDAEDLRDWRGSGTLVPDTSSVEPLNDQTPPYGWHWGNRGSVSGGMIEKPHKGNWNAIIEGEFDLAYTPLMEAPLGKGRMMMCTLDLEGREGIDPGATTLAVNLVSHAVAVAGNGKPAVAVRVQYSGNGAGEALLTGLGIDFSRTATPGAPGILVIGEGSGITKAVLNAFLAKGGKALILSAQAASALLGFGREDSAETPGTWKIPDWPELRGLSYSDLHLRAYAQVPLLTKAPKEGTVAGGGLLGLVRRGKGSALVLTVEPSDLDAETATYFRFSAWRLNRSIARILANMGAAPKTEADLGLVSVAGGKAGSDALYMPGFNTDFSFGDDPYRYFRW